MEHFLILLSCQNKLTRNIMTSSNSSVNVTDKCSMGLRSDEEENHCNSITSSISKHFLATLLVYGGALFCTNWKESTKAPLQKLTTGCSTRYTYRINRLMNA